MSVSKFQYKVLVWPGGDFLEKKKKKKTWLDLISHDMYQSPFPHALSPVSERKHPASALTVDE